MYQEVQTIPSIEENKKPSPSAEDTILPIKSPDENNPGPEHSHVDTDTETDENQNCSGEKNINCNNGVCTITYRKGVKQFGEFNDISNQINFS